MLKFAAVVGLVLWSSLAEAIRWEFDDGTTQWVDRQRSYCMGGTREFHQFPGTIDDGVWRIRVDPAATKSFRPSQPSVEVVLHPSGTIRSVRPGPHPLPHRHGPPYRGYFYDRMGQRFRSYFYF